MDNNSLSESNFNKDNLINHYKKQCNLFNLTGNLFYVLGDHKNCEISYVEYAKVIEKYYGE